MKLRLAIVIISILSIYSTSYSQDISISVDVTSNQKTISPYIYGCNNSTSQRPWEPVSAEQWQFLREVGVTILRENQGNNSSKYNWRDKLSSHPDWYNNVETHDWDYAALQIQKNLPSVQQMWALPMLGYVASDSSFNFDCKPFDGCTGTQQETNFCAEGDSTKYLKAWPVDSVVGILPHWINNLKINPKTMQYWNMDNEPELWCEKHDDIISKDFSAEDYVQRYVETAIKARAAFPNIKLVGPALSNEWGWYNWNKVKVVAEDGTKYTWIEYFIKRVSEEQIKAGVRLIDVFDIHFYPATEDVGLTLQTHRIWFDTTWVYPNGNGIKRLGPTDWNTDQASTEYIFKRSNDWFTQYMGKDHGVTMGVSEYGEIPHHKPNVAACWYASHLGTFANNNVELFCPWDWYEGMWEVMHLFTHYAGDVSVQSKSSQDSLVSAYASLTTKGDSLTIIIVNKDELKSHNIDLNIENILTQNGNVDVYTLSDLPQEETFISSTNNALKKSSITIVDNTIKTSLPKLSVTAIVVKATKFVPVSLE